MILNKADRLILKGFVGPYVVSFFIVEFVLVIQFMWHYIDDLLGRGFAVTDYLELIALFGVNIIPQALPLTILLSSVMVYGDMAEHFELSSLKSAGQSLVRIFRPALILAFATAGLSIVSSNYFKPKASKAFARKFNNMKLSKVTFALEEKVFNMDFNDHAIYTKHRSKDGHNLEKVMIYYTNQRNKNLLDVIVAERATMGISKSGKYMIMDLFNGRQYQETSIPNSKSNYLTKPDRKLPVNQATFTKYRKVFELSDIFRDMSNLSLERKKFDLLNAHDLLSHVDSIDVGIEKRAQDNLYSFGDILDVPKETTTEEIDPNMSAIAIKNKKRQREYSRNKKKEIEKMRESVDTVITAYLENARNVKGHLNSTLLLIPKKERQIVFNAAKSKNSALRTRTWNNYVQQRSLGRNKEKYLLRYHQIYCWALVCILLLFIGGPMGTIVRKGGFGYPLLVAIGFYMSFMILKILGERLANSGALSGPIAAWLPFICLLPFAVFVTYFALKDKRISMAEITSYIPKRLMKKELST